MDATIYTLYTPQFESISGTRATARAAFSVEITGTPAIYGAMFFTADLDNDLAAGLIEVSNMLVQHSQLSNNSDASAAAAELQKMLFGVTFTVNRATVMQNMQVAKDQTSTRASLSNAPPKIRVIGHAAVLLLLDGKPALRELGDSGIGLAQNTPSLLVFDKATRTWFTRIGTDTWLHSSRYTGPYIAGKTPSASALKTIAAALPERHPAAVPTMPPPAGKTPEVIVSTLPMCLVSINGQPNLTQVADGLFAVANANCDLFTTSADNAWWLLASGRWFTSTDLMNGPWTYSKPASIPTSFAQIDPHGTWGNVLASVPNTTQATEAVYQQTIPHVATLDRALAKAKLSTIGGPARFQPIAGTTMQYAANASSPLIYCKELYYLCDTAAWFVANAPNGPWALCDAVPEEIYSIPPSCPIYAATYVQVYNSDADSVTFGFTAGYMNSYENDGTVAYGTGYTYPGSIGAQDLVLGNNSDITDDDTWDTYGGYPNTYGYWPSYGDDFGGWGFYGYPGWGDYGLYPGAYWSGDGWWGGGRGFGVGFALGMGFGDAWRWGYHPWGWRDGSGWWNNHWGGAYRRGWDSAARSYNRAGAAGDISRYGQIGPYRKTTAGANRAEDNAARDDAAWHHAANGNDNVMTNRNGQVTQRRGDQMYTRADGAWQKSDGDGNRTNDGQAAAANGATGARKNQAAARTPDGSWRDGAARAGQRNGSGNFQERDDSPMASSQARNTNSDGFRPDPNHNFDGSPRGAFARGETNYVARGNGGTNDTSAQQGNGASEGGPYQRGGNFNGGGWGISDQGGTYAQRWGNDYDRGLPGFNQDTGWYDRTVSRPVNPYGYGYGGWSNGYRGYGQLSGWGGMNGYGGMNRGGMGGRGGGGGGGHGR